MERAGANGNGYAVIWDVDGVLIDSAERHRLAWQRLAAENHFPYTDEAFWAGFGRRNSDVIPPLAPVRLRPDVAATGPQARVQPPAGWRGEREKSEKRAPPPASVGSRRGAAGVGAWERGIRKGDPILILSYGVGG